MGKLKRKNVLGIFWSLTGFVGLVLYAGCATDLGEHLQSGQVLPLHGLQGRWVGSVTPSESACGKATKGSLSIGPKGFGFDPFQSTLTIQGEVSEDGRLHGSTTRRGADHQELVLIFDGTAATPGVLDGVLVSGRCHWAVSLHRG